MNKLDLQLAGNLFTQQTQRTQFFFPGTHGLSKKKKKKNLPHNRPRN